MCTEAWFERYAKEARSKLRKLTPDAEVGELLSLLVWAAQAELFANTTAWASASETAGVAAVEGR